MIKIPFVDLRAQYLSIQKEIDSAISNVMLKTSFIGGEDVKGFEAEFKKYLSVNHCIACANGTDSIEILLKAFGIGFDDEVIVPAISWISTSEAVSSVGAKPVFVDIHPEYYTIDTDLIEAKITSKTKAIIPVHLYGHPCDMDAVMNIAKKHNLIVIEDCAQSHGAKWNENTIGSIGDAASFSFYPGKNLGAYGDAGAMVAKEESIARVCRQIANHGQEGKHNHIIEGRNSRLDGLQASILRAKLPFLSKWTEQRQSIAKKYNEILSGSKLQLPKAHVNASHVFHLYVVQTNNRDALMKHLADKGIETAVHYPTALPFLKCYDAYNHKPEDFPIAFKAQSRILSLPIYAEITDEQVSYLAQSIAEFEQVQ